jgi:hypothetical protein
MVKCWFYGFTVDFTILLLKSTIKNGKINSETVKSTNVWSKINLCTKSFIIRKKNTQCGLQFFLWHFRNLQKILRSQILMNFVRGIFFSPKNHHCPNFFQNILHPNSPSFNLWKKILQHEKEKHFVHKNSFIYFLRDCSRTILLDKLYFILFTNA